MKMEADIVLPPLQHEHINIKTQYNTPYSRVFKVTEQSSNSYNHQ